MDRRLLATTPLRYLQRLGFVSAGFLIDDHLPWQDEFRISPWDEPEVMAPAAEPISEAGAINYDLEPPESQVTFIPAATIRPHDSHQRPSGAHIETLVPPANHREPVQAPIKATAVPEGDSKRVLASTQEPAAQEPAQQPAVQALSVPEPAVPFELLQPQSSPLQTNLPVSGDRGVPDFVARRTVPDEPTATAMHGSDLSQPNADTLFSVDENQSVGSVSTGTEVVAHPQLFVPESRTTSEDRVAPGPPAELDSRDQSAGTAHPVAGKETIFSPTGIRTSESTVRRHENQLGPEDHAEVVQPHTPIESEVFGTEIISPGNTASVLAEAEPAALALSVENDVPASPPPDAASPLVSAPTSVVDEPAPRPAAMSRRARIEEIPSEKSAVVKRDEGKSGQADVPAKPAVPGRETSSPKAVASPPAPELFADKAGHDYSPSAWAVRLAKAFPDRSAPSAASRRPTGADSPSLKPPPKPSMMRPNVPAKSNGSTEVDRRVHTRINQESPVIVSPATRHFLKPLVGIDPASVALREGPAATAITALHGAEALTIGETVAFSPGSAGEAPRQLGLLAHELTHVARQRQSRFIPPVARARTSPLPVRASSRHLDDEALARRVEARVVAAAENAPLTVPGFGEESGPQSSAPIADSAAEDWGGLPAPWEPFPEWVTSMQGSAPIPNATVQSGRGDFSSLALPAPAALSVERAEIGRSLEEEKPAGSSAVQLEPAKSVAPDLDLLAKQVYTVLKRRLEAERRRQLT